MKGRAACPRCGGEVRPPGVWSSRWSCRIHGDVYPLQPITAPSARLARQLGERSAVPLWLSWPMPRGWVVGAILHAGDEVSGVRATGVVTSGPNPMGGPADLMLVAEEPGVGLGARFAGVEGADPGAAVQQEPHAKLEVESRSVPLWWVDCPGDRAVYVGQWRGRWLWAVLRPQSAGVMLVEDLPIADLRDLGHEADLLPYGTPPPWLTREAPR
ncbi:MAG TPA: DUF6758 family protein [Jiangellaceae bacterium]|nr:DUF6758 family protein [Jiangellaceae bacterium]